MKISPSEKIVQFLIAIAQAIIIVLLTTELIPSLSPKDQEISYLVEAPTDYKYEILAEDSVRSPREVFYAHGLKIINSGKEVINQTNISIVFNEIDKNLKVESIAISYMPKNEHGTIKRDLIDNKKIRYLIQSMPSGTEINFLIILNKKCNLGLEADNVETREISANLSSHNHITIELILILIVSILIYSFWNSIKKIKVNELESEKQMRLHLALKTYDTHQMSKNNRGLVIHSAFYGTENNYNDVTKTIISYVANHQLDISVINKYLGGDPLSEKRKELLILYSYNNILKIESLTEDYRYTIIEGEVKKGSQLKTID